VVIGPAAEGPEVLAIRAANGQIVHAREAPRHEAVRLEFPVLVSVRSKPLPAVVVPLVGKPDGDPVVVKRPEPLDEAIVQLSDPLPREKLNNCRTTGQKFRAIAPDAVQGVAPRDSLGVTGVPGVLASRTFAIAVSRSNGGQGGRAASAVILQPGSRVSLRLRIAALGDPFEERRGQIALARVRQHGEND
jgi:hypothetical protein